MANIDPGSSENTKQDDRGEKQKLHLGISFWNYSKIKIKNKSWKKKIE